MKTHKVLLIYSLLLLVSSAISMNAQTKVKQQIDSLKHLIKISAKDTLKVKQYKALADIYLSQNQIKELLKVAEEGLSLSNTLTYPKGIIGMTLHKAIALDIAGEFDEALLLYNESLELAKSHDEGELVAKCYLNLGASYQFSGDYDLALKNQLLAYDLGDKLSKKDLAKLLNNIGIIYRQQKKYERAEEIYHNSFKIKKELKDSLGMAATLMNLGIACSHIKGQEKIAVNYMQRSQELYQRIGRLDEAATSNTALGQILFDQNNMSKAKEAYENAWAYFEKNPDQRYSQATLFGLGKIALKEKDYYAAETYFEQAVALTKSFSNKDSMRTLLYKLSGIKDTLGKKSEAYKMLKEAYAINDTLNQTTRLQAMEEMQAKFDVKEKDNELKISELNLYKQTRQRNIFLYGAIGLALFALTIFFFLKNKIRTNKKIADQGKAIQKQKIKELQQTNKLLALNSMIEGQEAERLRIAKDLHDSLGGLLSTVKNHFSTIQKEIEAIEKLDLTKKTNTLIDEACIEVRRISHNMMPHALSISGLQGAIEDLGEQLNEQGYQTTIEIPNSLIAVDETKKVTIYRLVQELISNIRKHAQAKTILIQLLTHKNEINLIIEDDGIGFDYKEAITKDGIGLNSINSRVEFLDGNINWDSQINKGTTVIINIPI